MQQKLQRFLTQLQCARGAMKMTQETKKKEVEYEENQKQMLIEAQDAFSKPWNMVSKGCHHNPITWQSGSKLLFHSFWPLSSRCFRPSATAAALASPTLPSPSTPATTPSWMQAWMRCSQLTRCRGLVRSMNWCQ